MQPALPEWRPRHMLPLQRAAAIRHVVAVHAKLADAQRAHAAKLIVAQQAWREEVRDYRDNYRERIVYSRN